MPIPFSKAPPNSLEQEERNKHDQDRVKDSWLELSPPAPSLNSALGSVFAGDSWPTEEARSLLKTVKGRNPGALGAVKLSSSNQNDKNSEETRSHASAHTLLYRQVQSGRRWLSTSYIAELSVACYLKFRSVLHTEFTITLNSLWICFWKLFCFDLVDETPSSPPPNSDLKVGKDYQVVYISIKNSYFPYLNPT